MNTLKAVKTGAESQIIDEPEIIIHNFKGITRIAIRSYSLPIDIVESNRDDVMLTDSTVYEDIHLGKTEKNTVSANNGLLEFKQGKVVGVSVLTVKGRITIEVPQGIALEYELASASGDIKLCAHSEGKLAISNVSGNTHVEYGGDNITVSTVSGNVSIGEPFVNQKINAISGRIATYCDSDSLKLDINSISGNVDVGIKKGVNCHFTHSTLSGSVSFEHSGDTMIGTRLLLANISTICGSIEVKDV